MSRHSRTIRTWGASVALAVVVPLTAATQFAPGAVGAPPGSDAKGPGGFDAVDKRFAAGDRYRATPGQKKALGKFRDAQVGWSDAGTPASLMSLSGALTKATGASPDAAARDFVRSQRELFGLSPRDVASLRLTMNDRDAKSGVSFLRYQQTHDGLDVFGATYLSVVDKSGRVLLVGGDLVPNLGAVPAASLDAAEAVAETADAVNPGKDARPGKRLGAERGRAVFENTLAVEDYKAAAPVTAEQVIVATAQGPRRAWRVEAEVAANADYTVLVDAGTGAVLFRENGVTNDNPEGTVYTSDDPETGTRSVVDFSGWVDTGGDTTSGNNTNTYQDATGDNTAHAADQPHEADHHFNYTWTDPWGNGDGSEGSLPLTGDERDAVVTQLFYYTNWFHDYAYDLGFHESARNFQDDNFGLGGTGGDALEAEADANFLGEQCQDNAMPPNDIPCRNNANFNTNGADGSVPRMQMFVGDDNGRRTQRANNRDTVIHEYTHGISGRIISDGNLQGAIQSDALGEGFSDAFATSINNDPVYGEYNNGDYDGGIRGVAYDDDNLELDDFINAAQNQHNNGRIWAMNMWEVRAALIAKYGAGSGVALHEQNMMTGLKLTVDTPSFHDARTGYVLADWVTSGGDFGTFPRGDNWCRIWNVYADNLMGVTAGPDDDADGTPTTSTDTPAECDPSASIAPVADTTEGAVVSFDASSSTVGGDSGDTLSYAWDLDGDGQFDDATGATTTWAYGDNGPRTVRVQVTNSSGYIDTASVGFGVANVAPIVTIDPAQLKIALENQSRSVAAAFRDSGWLDTYSGNVDLGTADLADVAPSVLVTTEGARGNPVAPTPDVGTVDATITYGDNGAYTVTVEVTDDDAGTGDDDFSMVVSNVDPTSEIDTSGEQIYDGVSAFILEAGEDLNVPASSQDPGSDDLTFTWDWDGILGGETPDVQVSLVNSPSTDPALSPTVQPRDVDLDATHAFEDACLYELEVSVVDDDGGSAADTATVLITGNGDDSKGHGWWLNQYRPKGTTFTPAELQCYLDIVGFLSMVFDEETDASTRAAATKVLNAPAKAPADVIFDQHLLGAWLNFANGSVKLDTLVDTNNDGLVDTTFGDVMFAAESVRIDPTSTSAEIKEQKDILARIVTQP